MTFTKQQLIFLGIVGVIIIVFLTIFFSGGRKTPERVNLTVWGVDSELAWDYAIGQYQDQNPNVRLEYIEFDPAIYERELINALAANRGPDIFMINNRWAAKHADKITPMPEGKISVSTFIDLFPQVAEQDFLTSEGQIYGLPLSVDTLALFYNRDIFDRKGAALTPKTWEEFLAIIPRLRTVDRAGSLTLAAAAIGGNTENISNAPDILELLMLQTGALTPNEYPSETIDSEAGKNTLEFYARFTNPKDPAYTWDNSFPSSIKSFANGETAMIFSYANDIPKIRAQNPFLNFAIEVAPQTNQAEAVNIANYWALTTSSKTQNPEVAWSFIIFAATDRETASYRLASTGQPPALRNLINEYLNDVDIGVFARQALTARSFYQGDDAAFRAIFDKIIRKATSGSPIYEILQEAEVELYEIGNRG